MFLGVDPAHPALPSEIESRLDALIAQGKREARARADGLGRDARLGIEADLRSAADELRRDLGPTGVGCFVDTVDGFWLAVTAPGAVEDVVKIGSAPYLLPLVERRTGIVLVVMVSRERGEIYRLGHGRLVPVDDLWEKQPRRHRDAQAWQQAKLERRLDGRANDHLNRVARELDRRVREDGGALVLAGEREHTSRLAVMLTHAAGAALIGTVRAEAHAGAAELLPLVLPLLEARAHDDETATVDRWRSELGQGRLAVEGWADMLAAAADGRVEQLLFTSEAHGTAGRCPTCGSIAVESTLCPLDGVALELEPDAVDLAVRLTLLDGGTVVRVDQAPDFAACEGVGALLRF
jgi:hypothetical protein